MSEFTERVGVAEVLLGDDVVAAGTYNLVVEQLLQAGAPAETGTRARGTLRLESGHRAHKAMTAPAVRLRLDHQIDLTVEVHLYVPGASFVAFTCADQAVLNQLLRRASGAA